MVKTGDSLNSFSFGEMAVGFDSLKDLTIQGVLKISQQLREKKRRNGQYPSNSTQKLFSLDGGVGEGQIEVFGK